MSMVQEFKTFIMRGNVVDLAVGVVIGAAFSKIVDALVGQIFMPIVGVLIGGFDFTNLTITLYKDAKLGVGAFIQSIIHFVIIGFCLFLVVKLMNRLQGPKPDAPPPEPTPTEKLLTEIRDLLKKE